MTKQKTPEQFIAQSQISKELIGNDSDSVLNRNLAGGALRLVAVNNEPINHRKLCNNEAKVAEVLDYTTLVGGGVLAENSDFIEEDIEYNTIDPDDVPESYFKLQQKIARNQGHGDMEITPELREQAAEVLADDQYDSLSKWSNYLRDESNGHVYPDWFKVYVWESVKKLGDFDKKKNRFDKRTRTTTGLYPELDPEALAYVYDKIDNHVIEGNTLDDAKLSQLLEGENFGKLYTYAIENAGMAITPEQQRIIKGTWKKYDQIEGQYDPDYGFGDDGEASDRTVVDNPIAMELAESLQGYRTGWCTAGNRTAAHQLSAGDFYVFYTDDGEGEDVVPRIAIRMEYDQVAEVRGIDPGQNLEANMEDVLLKKLKELPGGDAYFTKVENMRRVTEIDERVQGGGELTAADIVFLRFSGNIESFRHDNEQDPRIESLLENRSIPADVNTVLKSGEVDPTDLADQLIKDRKVHVITDNLDKFLAAGADPTDRLIKSGNAYIVAENLDKFLAAGANIDPTDLANQWIKSRNAHIVAESLDKFLAAGANIDPTDLADQLTESGKAYIVAHYIDKFLAAGADIDPTDIANQMIESRKAFIVIRNLDKFLAAGANIDTTDLANRLIESGEKLTVSENLDKFLAAGVNPTDLADQLIESGEETIVASRLNKFLAAGANIDPTDLADRLIESGEKLTVVNHLDKFLAAGISREELDRMLQ